LPDIYFFADGFSARFELSFDIFALSSSFIFAFHAIEFSLFRLIFDADVFAAASLRFSRRPPPTGFSHAAVVFGWLRDASFAAADIAAMLTAPRHAARAP